MSTCLPLGCPTSSFAKDFVPIWDESSKFEAKVVQIDAAASEQPAGCKLSAALWRPPHEKLF